MFLSNDGILSNSGYIVCVNVQDVKSTSEGRRKFLQEEQVGSFSNVLHQLLIEGINDIHHNEVEAEDTSQDYTG